jgi:hypothetical protein
MSRSRQNWRFSRNVKIDPCNTSPEVTLERAIIRGAGNNWANQIPTSSGLTHSSYDKRRCIDLVHRTGSDSYEFVELKISSDTPLYAGVEIFVYGILYLFSRTHRDALECTDSPSPMLGASQVHLRVLAPAAYYGGYDLRWLEALLNDSIAALANQLCGSSLEMDFAFEKFPNNFDWRPEGPGVLDQLAADAVANRRRL